MHRRHGVLAAALALTVTAGSAVTLAPTAGAAPAAARPGYVAVGDLTGDGIADRLTLSGDPVPANPCSYTLQVGLGSGRFADPVVGRLPVRDSVPAGENPRCPGLAVVLKAPAGTRAQLAVSWNGIVGTWSGPNVQTFTGFGTGTVRYAGGFGGQEQSDRLLSPGDIDGDGYGDIYQPGGQYAPEVWVGRNATWHELYHPAHSTDAELQFLDLNRAGGTDILAIERTGGFDDAVAVVDGRTGARQTLADPQDGTPDAFGTEYTLSVIDIDHNRLPDLLLVGRVPQDDGGVATVSRRFVNKSQGGRWLFVQQPANA